MPCCLLAAAMIGWFVRKVKRDDPRAAPHPRPVAAADLAPAPDRIDEPVGPASR